MLFSVCIPVYNTSQYLDECLASVLCQTEKDYEIVLVDDGSTDGSGEICDRYAARYPHIRVIHKENEGLMMTRRRAFREARGDYFICLDSDDALNDPNALNKIRCLIERENADLVIYEYIYAASASSIPDRIISLFPHPDGHVFTGQNKQELFQKLLLGKFLNPIVIKAASRRIVDLEIDYTQWKECLVRSQGEDLFQTLPLLGNAQRVAYLKEPLYFYRWNPESISRNIRPDYYYAYRTVYQRTDEYLEKWEFTPEDVHRINQLRLNMLLSVLLSSDRPDRQLWLCVLNAVSEDPFFRNLWEKRDRSCLSPYYQLAGKLILHKNWMWLSIAKKIIESLSQTKKRILKR